MNGTYGNTSKFTEGALLSAAWFWQCIEYQIDRAAELLRCGEGG